MFTEEIDEKAERAERINSVQKNVPNLIRFMQKPESLFFTYFNGVPININYITLNKNAKPHYAIELKLEKFQREEAFTRFEGFWTETDKGNVLPIKNKYIYREKLLYYLKDTFSERNLYLDERLISYSNFETILKEFPIFDISGIPIYKADIHQGKIFPLTKQDKKLFIECYGTQFSEINSSERK